MLAAFSRGRSGLGRRNPNRFQMAKIGNLRWGREKDREATGSEGRISAEGRTGGRRLAASPALLPQRGQLSPSRVERFRVT